MGIVLGLVSYGNYDLLLLADWLEEYGSSYDIVKSAAIRNNNFTLSCIKDSNIEYHYGHGCFSSSYPLFNSCGDGSGSGDGFRFGNSWGYGSGSGIGWEI